MISHVMKRTDVSGMRVKTDRALGILLAVLFLLVYTQGYVGRMGVPRGIVKMTLEFPVMLMLVHLLNRGVRPLAPGWIFIVLYVMWTILSAIHNDDQVFKAFLYCRYVVYAYIVFAVVWSTPMTLSTIMRINAFIAMLFVFQILASAHEVFVLGERTEAHVGALYAEGGELATEFPLFAMALTMSLYLYYRRNPLLLVLSCAFFLIGYASGKRAIYFFGPGMYFFILGWYALRDRSVAALKGSARAGLVFLCFIPFLLMGVSRSGGIGQSDPSKPREQIAHALNYAIQYMTREHTPGQTAGRVATSRRVISSLLREDKGTVLFGWGPSAAMGRGGRVDVLMIEYGITGWARDAISIGVPGMVLYVLFHVSLFRQLQRSPPPQCNKYWHALHFGTEVVFVMIMMCYFMYSSIFSAGGGQLSYVYFYLLALLMSPQHRHITAGA